MLDPYESSGFIVWGKFIQQLISKFGMFIKTTAHQIQKSRALYPPWWGVMYLTTQHKQLLVDRKHEQSKTRSPTLVKCNKGSCVVHVPFKTRS